MPRFDEIHNGLTPQSDAKGFRHYGDGIAGPIVTARLQAYSPDALGYIDMIVNADGTLTVAGGGGGGGTVTQGPGGVSAWKVDGSAVTQPVSAVALPLPTGAATETTLAALSAKLPAALVGGRLDVNVGAASALAVTDNAGSLTVDAVDTSFGATVTPKAASVWDVSDRAARLLGHVTVDNASLAVTQSTSPWVVSGGSNVFHMDDNAGSLTVDGTVSVTGYTAEGALAADTTGAMPAQVKVVAGYDPDFQVVRAIRLDDNRLPVSDWKVRRLLEDVSVTLHEMRDLIKEKP